MIPFGCLQIPTINTNGYKESMKFELKTCQFAVNMFKSSLEGSVNFERASLKLQLEPLGQKSEREREEGKGGQLQAGCAKK